MGTSPREMTAVTTGAYGWVCFLHAEANPHVPKDVRRARGAVRAVEIFDEAPRCHSRSRCRMRERDTPLTFLSDVYRFFTTSRIFRPDL